MLIIAVFGAHQSVGKMSGAIETNLGVLGEYRQKAFRVSKQLKNAGLELFQLYVIGYACTGLQTCYPCGRLDTLRLDSSTGFILQNAN